MPGKKDPKESVYGGGKQNGQPLIGITLIKKDWEDQENFNLQINIKSIQKKNNHIFN